MEWQSPAVQQAVSLLLFGCRAAVPALFLAVIWGCCASLRRGRRREEPVMMLEDAPSRAKIPVLYWENSLGRSRSCDIVLPDPTASRDHAVLYRREAGWFVMDSGSKAGTFVNGKKIQTARRVAPGDLITMGSTALRLKRVQPGDLKRAAAARPAKRAPRPAPLLLAATAAQLLLGVQACLQPEAPVFEPLLPLAGLLALEWALFAYSLKGLGRVSFELETLAFLLCGTGLMLLTQASMDDAWMQLLTMAAGVALFCGMIPFMGDLERVMRARPWIEAAAVALFAVNLAFGVASHGARNWISIGPVTVQPSEFIKVAFLFAGASTLDHLQTKRNLTEFIVFSGVCIGALFLMRDFGTACVFFAAFLLVAFMRSGSIRTIVLICAAAVFGVFLILQFRPYIMDRFAAWRHVWEYMDSTGYQQTRVLTYAASGGLFGVGLGRGYLSGVFASTSDLVFGMLCEELGLLTALGAAGVLAAFAVCARADVTRSRSTFYSITGCAAAGMLLFQAALNLFGSTDLLPLTGVTLPFVSAGGSSMISAWGLLAFLKASDERTYAVRRPKERR